MNKKEFSQALRHGIGSAIIELQNSEDKSAYREFVLRCCLRDISYDWQSVGTKGVYLYNAICALDERDYYDFEKVIMERFLSRCNDRLLCQLLSILDCYIWDGSVMAKNAVHEKYNYFVSKKGRLAKHSNIDEGFQWDEVANQLFYIDGFSAFKRYVTDVGEILHKNPNNKRTYYDDWFSYRAKEKFGEKRISDYFTEMHDKSKAVRAIVEANKADELSRKQYNENREQENVTIPDLVEAALHASACDNPRWNMKHRLRMQFRKNATEADFIELAKTIVNHENDTVKSLLLLVFQGKYLFPLEISPLIEYAQSNNELLTETAIDRLKEFKDKRIHD